MRFLSLRMPKQLLLVGALFVCAVALLGVVASPRLAHSATTQVGGWAWSSTAGWICFYDPVRCPLAGVVLDASNNLVGYAWSSNIGWIQFGGLSSFPSNASQTVTFTSSQSWVVPGGVSSVQALVVAGGGGGGSFGGGGGGGGVIYNAAYSVTPGNIIPVTVGKGGYGDYDFDGTGDNGENSVFGSLTSIGGGGGGSMFYNTSGGIPGANGGSGGGGSNTYRTTASPPGGEGVSGQGHAGGNGGGSAAPWFGGGGGGAASVGSPGGSGGGDGGAGIANSITGTTKYYAGGGGGAVYTFSSPGVGGVGGGGDGGKESSPQPNGVSGTANTGGGGGGGSLGRVGGDGGSGVVIVKYAPSVTYPSAVNAKVQSDRSLTGWAKALSADGNGWDGWISLDDTGHGDGVTIDTNGNFQGYAWGGEVLGWIDFCQSQGCVTITPPCATTAGSICSNSTTVSTTDVWCAVTTTSCTGGQICSSGACATVVPQGTLTVTPLRIRKNATVQISWTATNASSCSVRGSYPGGSLGPYTVSPSTSAPVPAITTFTLSCVGPNSSTYVVDKKTVNVVPTFQEI